MFDIVSSFLWDTGTDMADPIQNNSTLYKLLAKEETKETKETKEAEKLEECEKTPVSNVSSLYKIIATQNLPMKKVEQVNEIEYHEVLENPHFEKLNQETIAENALYFVEEDESNVSVTKSDMGHLSSISFSFLDKELTYDVVDESKISLDLTDKGYVPMEGRNEVIYSSPRSSMAPSREMSPSYVGPDPDPKDGELFYAASEVVSRRPPTPFKSSVYEDVDLEDRELPPLPDDYVDVEDYCRHRAENTRKFDTLKGKTVHLVKVRSKLNRAWKSVKHMMNQEAPKLPDRELETPESPYSCLSENSDYFSERSKPSAETLSDVDTFSETGSRFDQIENGLTTLLRRRKDRSGAVSPFRKSRHFVEVSLCFSSDVVGPVLLFPENHLSLGASSSSCLPRSTLSVGVCHISLKRFLPLIPRSPSRSIRPAKHIFLENRLWPAICQM